MLEGHWLEKDTRTSERLSVVGAIGRSAGLTECCGRSVVANSWPSVTSRVADLWALVDGHSARFQTRLGAAR